MILKMENINIEGKEYKVLKRLESDDWIYYYTLDLINDNEVVFLCKNLLDENSVISKVDEREYAILMNKFTLKNN